MAIFNYNRPTPVGYHASKAAVESSDTKQHPRNNLQQRTVQKKRVSPLGPTR